MLINKGEKITFRYNGIYKTLEKGDSLDVRDFDTQNKEVKNVEKHITSKYPGQFDVKDTKSGFGSDKEYESEIKALKDKVSEMDKSIQKLKDTNENLTQRHAAMSGEVESAKKAELSARREFKRMESENKDLHDEIKNLRLSIRKPK